MAFYYGEPDLESMLARDFGVPVVFVRSGEEIASMGILDTFDEDMMSGDAASFVGKRIAVVVKTSTFSDLSEGATLTVDGIDHRVASVRQQGDGATTLVVCARI